jgi:histidinol-phosphate aminotransferase
MHDFEKLARPCLRQFSPYVPGRPIEEIREKFGLKRVVKLASNENPLGPSPLAVEAIRKALRDLNRYPEGGSSRLRAALAKRLGVEPSCVLVGSGSDEIIELIAKSFVGPGDEIVASEHAFIRYKMAGQLMDARVVEVRMRDFRHDLLAMAAAVTPKTKAVFVANPNNPTGTYVPKAEFAEALRRLPREILLVMDEAYYEYAKDLPDYPDSVAFRKEGAHPGIVTLRTFSKIYGLAGLRVGYAVAEPSVVRQIDKIRPPFNVTSPAQAGCEAALADRRHVEASARVNSDNREWLCGALKKNGFELVPSAGNFVLVRTRTGGQKVFEDLLRRGIIVRPMAEYGFPEHVRVTVGTKEETEMFLAELLLVDRP